MTSIREMTEDDIDICTAIYKRAFHHEGQLAEVFDCRGYFMRFISESDKYAYCILNDSEVVGLIAALQIPDMLAPYTLYIDNLAVDPAQQKHGFGREALEQFMALFPKEINIKLITEKSRPAYGMYEKMGFLDMEVCVMERSLLTDKIRELKALNAKYKKELAELKGQPE